jgi:hypothetical protein
LPAEIRKVLTPTLESEGGIPAATLADMIQQLRVEWAQAGGDAPDGEHE